MLSILIFAHVPPPMHGQSYMVAQLLEELRGYPSEVRVFHVDSRVSHGPEEIGRPGLGKLLRMLGYCFQAIRLRWRHGPMLFYYIPAPGKRGAVYRDWLVMALCRPFFRNRLVLHWHALGLREWLAGPAGFLTGTITRRLLGQADLSLVLMETVRDDVAVFHAKQVRVLPNGIPDPCPDFDTTVLPARRAHREREPGIFRVLFLAHCTREKGLFDALGGVFEAQRQLAGAHPPVHLTLKVAGAFLNPEEYHEFLAEVSRLTAKWPADLSPPPTVEYVGFAKDDLKRQLLQESDCFCFPTFYANEVMPVALIEALAYGLPVVSTHWRAIPAMLPAEGCWLVPTHKPAAVGKALCEAMGTTAFPALRGHFVANFRRDVFGARFRAALRECFPDTNDTTRQDG